MVNIVHIGHGVEKWFKRMNALVREDPEKVNSGLYPRPVVGRLQAEWVYGELQRDALRSGCRADVVRLACAVALTRRAGARHGELAAVLVDDIDRISGRFRPRRFPQGRQATNLLLGEPVTLSDEDLAVVDAWLMVRDGFVRSLRGGNVAHLFVTVHHTHSNGITVSPGLPIQVNGLEQAWRRHARHLNYLNGGQPGWDPLPTRYEPLRRSWWH